MKIKFKSYILHLLIPGLGHIFWKEYLFGIFIFLIMLIAVVLFVVTFFLDIPSWLKIIIVVLPVVFYLFTFLDLSKSINNKKQKVNVTSKRVILFLVVGLLYQILIPIAPTNFLLHNLPELFYIETTELEPVYSKGAFLKASRLAYYVNIFYVEKPILYKLPERFDFVRYNNENGQAEVGLILGLSGEEIEIAEGVIAVDGFPVYNPPEFFSMIKGDCQLTYVDHYSILVGKMNLNTIYKCENVSYDQIIGKVDRVF